MQPDHRGSAGRAALLLLGSLALAALILHKSFERPDLYSTTGVEACSPLLGTLPGQLCNSFHTAVGTEKFDAAVHWRQLSPATCKSFLVIRCQHTVHTSWSHALHGLHRQQLGSQSILGPGPGPVAAHGKIEHSAVGCCTVPKIHKRMCCVLVRI